MLAVDEDEAQGDQDGQDVSHEVEAGQKPGGWFEDGDYDDGDGEGSHHPDHAGATREETGGGGTCQKLELNKLGGVALVGAGEQKERHGKAVKN